MDAYADYEFYITKYNGKNIDEQNFRVSILSATQYIRMLTAGRSDLYEGDEIKYAACAAADAYAQAFKATLTDSPEISSENTDGYSVSYVTQRMDGETQEALFKRKAYEAAKLWLAGTGLLNRRVGVLKR